MKLCVSLQGYIFLEWSKLLSHAMLIIEKGKLLCG